jgi:hypothetical protein
MFIMLYPFLIVMDIDKKKYIYIFVYLAGWVTCSGPITENWPSRPV